MNEVMTIQDRIYEIRGQRVMLDRDLAELYGVETKQLVRQVKRNLERFEGEDFMFELTNQEYNTLITSLRCQNGTSNLYKEIFLKFQFGTSSLEKCAYNKTSDIFGVCL